MQPLARRGSPRIGTADPDSRPDRRLVAPGPGVETYRGIPRVRFVRGSENGFACAIAGRLRRGGIYPLDKAHLLTADSKGAGRHSLKNSANWITFIGG